MIIFSNFQKMKGIQIKISKFWRVRKFKNSRVLGLGRARSTPTIPLWREGGSEMGFRQFARLLANSDGTYVCGTELPG